MEKSEIFIKIREIVNEIDPIGIVYDNENIDEYDAEVAQIAELITQMKDKNQLAKKIQDIFIDMFDKDIASDPKPYIEIAKKII